MRIYYQDADVTVAASGLEVHGRKYPLGEIEQAWRRGRRAAGRKAVIAGVVLAAMVAVEISVGLLTSWIWAGPGLLLVAVILLVRVVAHLAAGSTGLQALEDLRRYGRLHELWVTVAHAPILVLSTDDAIRYGQVCRALSRALSDHEDALGGYPRR
ncbi:DUF6232 family protein [Actinoplanes sp. L3-i22]|uniref:DUF6232 family protein n=1 Tax=Actinoplanes sp. L3-i22 TaxID=2836373 RepID=UPI001C745BA7|nr:DUF6232 family protein [Actinoplanes sp. L3-i22]BCY11474.1 hypothetical protein L3i22_065620 [Actinoplanes sp. L3-i22]